MIKFIVCMYVTLCSSLSFNDSLPAVAFTEIETIYICAYTYSVKYSLDANVVYNVIKVESNFNKNAVSKTGDYGLMQLQKPTAYFLLNHLGYAKDSNLFDIRLNIELGCLHLKGMLNKYKGDYRKALAAYNMGSVALNKRNGKPYEETRQYVDKILK